jgi:hypothetical protein
MEDKGGISSGDRFGGFSPAGVPANLLPLLARRSPGEAGWGKVRFALRAADKGFVSLQLLVRPLADVRRKEVHRLKPELRTLRLRNLRVVLKPELQKAVQIDKLDVHRAVSSFAARVARKSAGRDE